MERSRRDSHLVTAFKRSSSKSGVARYRRALNCKVLRLSVCLSVRRLMTPLDCAWIKPLRCLRHSSRRRS